MTVITERTASGGTLYAAVDDALPAGRSGALAYSAQIAQLAPFGSAELARSAIEKVINQRPAA